MGLFSQLRRYYRSEHLLIEDPHTEIVAQVLRNSRALTLEWLHKLWVTGLEAPEIRIWTQFRFEPLPGHLKASKPDIVISLRQEDRSELVFIESKVPSKQGRDQLQRYADHLASETRKQGLTKATLVFITRDYEPATPAVVAGVEVQPAFIQTRWFHFYQCLKGHINGDGLAAELKTLMEEDRMSLGNQFRATDVVALENFVSVKALMDETLESEVSRAAGLEFGKDKLWVGFEELRDDPRYVLHIGDWKSRLVFLMGYWLPHENPDVPVRVGLTVYFNADPDERQSVLASFRAFCSESGGNWVLFDYPWITLQKLKPLPELMATPDHVRAVKDYLLEALSSLLKNGWHSR